MKTTFDLPDELVRKAKASRLNSAAHCATSWPNPSHRSSRRQSPERRRRRKPARSGGSTFRLEQPTRKLGGSSSPSRHRPLEPAVPLCPPAKKSMTARAVVDADVLVFHLDANPSVPSQSLSSNPETFPSPVEAPPVAEHLLRKPDKLFAGARDLSPRRHSLRLCQRTSPAAQKLRRHRNKLSRPPESREYHLPSFPGHRREGNATFPALVVIRESSQEPGNEGTWPSLLSWPREKRERGVPCSQILRRGGNAIFPPLQRAGEQGTRCSPLSFRRESGEGGVPPTSHLQKRRERRLPYSPAR